MTIHHPTHPPTCSKPLRVRCDAADGYIDYNACTSTFKPEIRVKSGSLQVQGSSVTISASRQVTLESGTPSCVAGASVAIDGLACTVEEHKAGLVDLSGEIVDLSGKIDAQAATMQTEFGIKLPALKAELTEIVRKSEETTSTKIDSSLKAQADSVGRDLAKMKVDLEKVVETDITALKTKVEEMGKKIDAIPDLSDKEYTSEQALFVMDYAAMGKGTSGFAHLTAAPGKWDANLRLRVEDGALNVKTNGPDSPAYFTTHPFPGGRASQDDHFKMVIHPKIVGGKIMVDGSKSGQITAGFASKQADKIVDKVAVPQRKYLFAVAFWASKNGEEYSVCIEGADNKCAGKAATVNLKNSQAVKSVVLRYFPKSNTNPNTLVEVEAYLGLNGKGTSLGKGTSQLMKGVNFNADDMFFRQGLDASESKQHGVTVTAPKQLMIRGKRDSYKIRAHPRRCGIGGTERNVADEAPRSGSGGWPSYGFQQCCSQGTCTMDVQLDKVYEVHKQAVCGYPGGSHRPSGSWVFEAKVGNAWKVLDTYQYNEWTVGNCYAGRNYQTELKIPAQKVVASREFRVRSTSGWTNNHMLMFNWGIWGCEGACSSGGSSTMNINRVAISVVEQRVGLTEIINLLLAQQIATAQIAVQAGFLALAQGAPDAPLNSLNCDSSPSNVITSDKRNSWAWTASRRCGGIGGHPRNIADNVRRTTSSGWTSYGFQQNCCGNADCYIDIDFQGDQYQFCSFGMFGYPGGSHKPNNRWYIQGWSDGSWKTLATQQDNSKWVTGAQGSFPAAKNKYIFVDNDMEKVLVSKLRIKANGFTNSHMLAFNFEAHGEKPSPA